MNMYFVNSQTSRGFSNVYYHLKLGNWMPKHTTRAKQRQTLSLCCVYLLGELKRMVELLMQSSLLYRRNSLNKNPVAFNRKLWKKLWPAQGCSGKEQDVIAFCLALLDFNQCRWISHSLTPLCSWFPSTKDIRQILLREELHIVKKNVYIFCQLWDMCITFT